MPGENAEVSISQMEEAVGNKQYDRALDISDRLEGETDNPQTLQKVAEIGHDPGIQDAIFRRIEHFDQADIPPEAKVPLIDRALSKAYRYGAFEDEDRLHSALVLANAYGLEDKVKNLISPDPQQTQPQPQPAAAPTSPPVETASSPDPAEQTAGPEDPRRSRVEEAINSLGSLDRAIQVVEAGMKISSDPVDIAEAEELLKELRAYKEAQEAGAQQTETNSVNEDEPEELQPSVDRVGLAIDTYGSLEGAILAVEKTIGTIDDPSDLEALEELLNELRAAKTAEEAGAQQAEEESLENTVIDITDEKTDLIEEISQNLEVNPRLTVRITPEIFAALVKKSGFPFIDGIKLKDCAVSLGEEGNTPELQTVLDFYTIPVQDSRSIVRMFRGGVLGQTRRAKMGLTFKGSGEEGRIGEVAFNPADQQGQELGLRANDIKKLKDTATKLPDVVSRAIHILLSDYQDPFGKAQVSVSSFRIDPTDGRLVFDVEEKPEARSAQTAQLQARLAREDAQRQVDLQAELDRIREQLEHTPQRIATATDQESLEEMQTRGRNPSQEAKNRAIIVEWEDGYGNVLYLRGDVPINEVQTISAEVVKQREDFNKLNPLLQARVRTEFESSGGRSKVVERYRDFLRSEELGEKFRWLKQG